MEGKFLCRFCGSQEGSFNELRAHCKAEHINEFIDVQHHLGKVDEQEIWASKIAAEGMKGYGERSDAKSK